MYKFFVLSIIIVSGNSFASNQIKAGQKEFQKTCAVCHTVGGGRLVGPDLKGVNQKREEAWLLKFIKSSQALIKSGDKEAVKLFKEYNNMPMPDANLSEAQIESILEFIKSKSEPKTNKTKNPKKNPETKFSENQIILGQNLFDGQVRFKHGGASCISCHNYESKNVWGGGILAKDLTEVKKRMGQAGIAAIIKNPPFPIMAEAYADENKLTTEEQQALTAFLISEIQKEEKNYGLNMLGAGILGTGLFIAICSLIWRRRKREAVNQAIFDRQTISTI